MKITEIILDWVATTRLYEMTKSRDNGKNLLEKNSYALAEHMVKLVMFGEVRDTNHWCNEVNGWLRPLNKLKVEPNHKRFDFDTIYYYLWKSWLETIEEVQEHMEDLEKEYRQSYRMMITDPPIVHKKVMNIMTDVCHDLSLGNFTDIRGYL